VSRVPAGDDGTALVEFSYLSVLLLIPLVYVMLLVFTLQRAAFAVSAAAREAGRAYVTGANDADGRARAELATELTIADHRLGDGAELDIGAPSLLPGAAPGLPPTRGVQVEVRYVVELPVFGDLFGGLRLGSIPVTGEHFATFDTYRAR